MNRLYWFVAVAVLMPVAAWGQTGLGSPAITATAKGPNQINLSWSAVSNPGYGYLIEIQSGGDSRYSAWQELFENVKSMLAPFRDVAMQYSPNNMVFVVSVVDGGTLEMVRGFGKNVVGHVASSATCDCRPALPPDDSGTTRGPLPALRAARTCLCEPQ